METIRGKTSLDLSAAGLMDRLAGFKHVLLDLGTGDGRYARALAERHPNLFIVGLDACRENLYRYSRLRLPNLLFAIASAQGLPRELDGLISHVTINFPWGSLLQSLLQGDPRLMHRLGAVLQPHAELEVRLNGGALAEAGWVLEDGAEEIRQKLSQAGWRVGPPFAMDSSALRSFPSTWARRLAFGRHPFALTLRGQI